MPKQTAAVWPLPAGGSAPAPEDAAAAAAAAAVAANETSGTALPAGGRATLRSVQVWFRHGARAPFYRPPPWVDPNPYGVTNPYWPDVPYNGCVPLYPGVADVVPIDVATGTAFKDETSIAKFFDFASDPLAPGDGSCRYAWLVPGGLREAKDLGAALRARYIEGPPRARVVAGDWKDAAPHVFASTTNTHRTLNTLRGVLAGAWPDVVANGTRVPAATGGYPAFFNGLVGGNSSSCKRVKDRALAQARKHSDTHYQGAANRDHVADFERQHPGVNLSACVVDGTAAQDLNWAKSRCWQMVYEAASGALAAGVDLPGGVTNSTVAMVSDLDSRFWNGAFHPTAAECELASPADCADLLKAEMGWGPWLVPCNMRRFLGGKCGTCALQAGKQAFDGCVEGGGNGGDSKTKRPPPSISLFAAHDTHMNIWSAMLGAPAGKNESVAQYWPWTTANYAFELWEEDGESGKRQPWVRVLFGDVPVKLGPAQQEFITLDEFEAWLKQYVLAPDEREAWCKGKDGRKKDD